MTLDNYTKEQLIDLINELKQALKHIENAQAKMDKNDYNKSSTGYSKFESQGRNYLNTYKQKLADICISELKQ